MILKPAKGKLLNRSHWMSRGLQSCWLFSESPQVVGRAFDYTGNNHGTLVADTHSISGKFGPALDFDGTGDWVNAGDNGFPDGSAPRTVSAWYNTSRSFEDGQYATVLAYGTENANEHTNIIMGNTAQFGGERIAMSTYGTGLGITSVSNDGLWHFFAGTFDGTTWKVYHDGVFENSDTLATTTVLAGITRIGAHNESGAVPWTGQIDIVCVYSRALTAGEVLRLYQRPFQMFEGSGL